jgi:hypothetical protein
MNGSPNHSAPARSPVVTMTWLEWATVAMAFTAEQLVDVPRDASAMWAVVGGVGWTAWARALRAVFVRQGFPIPVGLVAWTGPVAVAGVTALLGLPTSCGGEGASPEAMLLAVLRGGLLVMLAVGVTTTETRFALATTLFMVVLASIVSEHSAAGPLAAVYAAVATGGLAARGSANAAGGVWQRVPRTDGFLACLVVAATVATLDGTAADGCRAITGWMPLSGGNALLFPWARDGIGDGENLVAAKKDPQATGPVNSGIFANSHKPSLYDLFSDLYGEPPSPKDKKRSERTVSLAPEEAAPADLHLADSAHAGREFSTIRNRRTCSRRPVDDLSARALLSLNGPVPAHLRLAVYDRFDGREWRPDPPAAPGEEGGLEAVGGDWMRWVEPASADAAVHPSPSGGDEMYAITIGRLETTALPLPTRSTALRIDRVDRSSFFRVPHPELATLDGVAVPAGTNVHVRSRAGGVDGSGSVGLTIPPMTVGADLPASPDWVRGQLTTWGIMPTGAGDWPLVERVVRELQHHCAFDDDAVAPEACSDTLAHFLLIERRGRPYDFAGAAALLLRGCGFRTRLAAGLRVSGSRRDSRSRRWIAIDEDAHVWAEILDASGRWIPIEATPGRTVRPPVTSPWSQFLATLTALATAARARSATIVGLLAAAAGLALVVRRWWRTWVDAATTVWWRHTVRRPSASPLAITWWLLAWRGWLAGCPHHRHETVREWCGRTVAPLPDGRLSLGFLAAFEREVYGTGTTKEDRLWNRQIAEAAAERITVRSLQSAGRPRRSRIPEAIG